MADAADAEVDVDVKPWAAEAAGEVEVAVEPQVAVVLTKANAWAPVGIGVSHSPMTAPSMTTASLPSHSVACHWAAMHWMAHTHPLPWSNVCRQWHVMFAIGHGGM